MGSTAAASLRFLSIPSSSFFSTSPSLPSSLSLLSPSRKQPLRLLLGKERHHGALRSSASSETWLLEPVGDGDSRHIGYKVPLPNALEIASNVVTVGRLPEKADLVIPVATVSGVHARLEKKEGALLVTDLDSTNGTFIDDERLRPGAIASVAPGSCITFGDANLAIFRASKVEVEAASIATETEESGNTLDADAPRDNTKSAS